MKRLIICILLSAAAWCRTFAQEETYDLGHCIGYALIHNTGILLAEAGLDSSREQLLYSKLDLLPTLNLYVNQYFNWGRSVDMQELVIVRNRLTQQTSGSVGASFSIFDGFARLNTIAANRALVAAARADAALAAVQLKADIARAYLGAVLAELTVGRLEESRRNVAWQISRVRAEAESGARQGFDILELEARAADIEARIEEARGEQEFQMVQLCNLMGYQGEIQIDTDIVENFCEAGDYPLDEFVPPVATAAQANRVKAAEYVLTATRGALMPTLNVSAAYGTYYSDASADTFREQLDGNRNPSVSLSLGIPIFNGNPLASVARARSELEAEKLRLRQAEEKACSDFVQVCRMAETLKSQERSCRIKGELCREKFEVATTRYKSGAISASDWLEACEDLAQSECELVQCRCKYLFQLKIIDFYRDGCQ